MASEKIVEITSENFATEVESSDKPVLVDFWAAWCGPCQMVAPVLEELADEMEAKIRIGKVNVDDHQALAQKYQVSSIPTFILFENGEVKGRMMGAMPKASFQKFIESHA